MAFILSHEELNDLALTPKTNSDFQTVLRKFFQEPRREDGTVIQGDERMKVQSGKLSEAYGECLNRLIDKSRYCKPYVDLTCTVFKKKKETHNT